MDKHNRYQNAFSVVVGLIILAAIIFFAFYLPRLHNASQTSLPAVSSGLGEVGARCGGELRLPCKPGNECRVTDLVKGVGACVKVMDNPAPVKP